MVERNPVPKSQWTIEHLRESDLTVEELKEKRDKFVEAGWKTAAEEVQALIDELHEGTGLEERLVDIKSKIAGAEERGLGDDPSVEKLRTIAQTLEERLERRDPIESRGWLSEESQPSSTGETLGGDWTTGEETDMDRIEVLEERADLYERVGWESQAEDAREEIEVLQAEGGEDAETDPLSSSGGALSSGPSVDDIESTNAADLEPARTVDVDAALEKWDVDKTESDIREALARHKQRLETFEDAGWEGMAKQTRAGIQVLQAAEQGRSEVEFEGARHLHDGDLRSRGE